MAVYTPLTRADLVGLLRPYGITELVDHTPLERGNTNTSYVLRTGAGRFVLTVFESKTPAEVLDLARLMHWLDRHHFPSSVVRPTAKGELVAHWQHKPILLKEWVPGDFIPDLAAEQLAQIGQALARLHRIPAPDYVPTDNPFGLATFPDFFGRGVDRPYEQWLRDRYSTLQAQLPTDLPKGLIHSDLFYDNALFAAGQLRAIIDFEVASHYYCLFDIGMTAVGCCLRNGTVNLDRVSALVRGYERERHLTPQERQHLQLFTDYAATAMSRWRYWKYHFDAPNPAKQDKHWEMVNTAEAVQRIGRVAFWERVFPFA